MSRHSGAIDPTFLAFQEALARHYVLEREIGRGGMAVVYLARDVRLDRPVAIKLLPTDFGAQEKLRERFLREARTAARLSHPHIVPIHAVDEVGPFVYYVMAFVDGETLGQRVYSRGPLPPGEATRVLREVASALSYAHAQGVIHRDVKPANILLERSSGRALVTDFGIARVAESSGGTVTGELLGTPEYMSPEQAAGEAVDARSDIYSLGAVGFYIVSGSLPFTASTIQAVLAKQITQTAPPVASVAAGVPRSLSDAIDACLAKDPAQRYQSGDAVADGLAPALVTRPEVPVPIRAFLDVRKMSALVVAPAIMTTGGIVLVTTGLPRIFTTGWYIVAIRGVGAGSIAFAAVIPLVLITRWLRPLLRAGYGVRDIAGALRANFERKREEHLFDHGTVPSDRERVLNTITLAGISANVVSWLAMALGATADWLLPVAFVSGLAWPIAGVLSATTSRLRTGKSPWWARRWEGVMGRWLTKLGTFKLGPRAAAADRPTEMAIAFSVQALFDELPKTLRQSLGNIPAVVQQLEHQAREMRQHVSALDASIAEAKAGPAAVRQRVGNRHAALLADLASARSQASERLGDVLAALEATRLDLLRLRSGQGSAQQITQNLSAARELGEHIERLLSGQADVDATLRSAPSPPGLERTPA